MATTSMDLSAFLFENVEKTEHKFIAATKRIKGADGKPILWEVRPLTAAEDDAIRQNCYKRVPVPGRKNVFQRELDTEAYSAKVVAASTVFPDLNNAELQNSYHVMGAEALLKAMLTPGEYITYMMEVQGVNDFGDLGEDIEEAKN